MRTYLTIISLVLFICAVSSRSIPSFFNEDETHHVQRQRYNDNLDEALLLTRLRNLLDADNANTGNRRTHIESDESDDQDSTSDDDNDGALEAVRKKRQTTIDDEDNDDDNNNNDNNNNVIPDESAEDDEVQSVFQKKQTPDISSSSEEESKKQLASPIDQITGDLNGKTNEERDNNDDDSELIENID